MLDVGAGDGYLEKAGFLSVEERFRWNKADSSNLYVLVGQSSEKQRKRQLQQRSRQKGTATQERWLFPFSCKRKVTAKKDGEKTPREANPHWAP